MSDIWEKPLLIYPINELMIQFSVLLYSLLNCSGNKVKCLQLNAIQVQKVSCNQKAHCY